MTEILEEEGTDLNSSQYTKILHHLESLNKSIEQYFPNNNFKNWTIIPR